jgi:hypothetical protein
MAPCIEFVAEFLFVLDGMEIYILVRERYCDDDGPAELHVDDAGVAELVIEALIGHGAERRAAEVEVVSGDRVVVHVGDHDRLRISGASRVVNLEASYLEN